MKRTRRHLGIKIICCVLAIILCVGIVLFGRLGVTLLTVKSDEDLGIYYINYREDYKLQPLLDAGGVKTQDELARYLIRILLKGLPVKIDYDVPALACSTFFAKTPEGGFLLGRNLDNQETDLAVVKTAPKDGYRSVSVVNLSFLGYDKTHTPAKLKDRIVAMGAPYFPLDGVNEKGFAVGVLQLQAPPTDQNTDKVDVDTTLAIRVLLDMAATVEEAVALLRQYDMHASAGGSSSADPPSAKQNRHLRLHRFVTSSRMQQVSDSCSPHRPQFPGQPAPASSASSSAPRVHRPKSSLPLQTGTRNSPCSGQVLTSRIRPSSSRTSRAERFRRQTGQTERVFLITLSMIVLPDDGFPVRMSRRRVPPCGGISILRPAGLFQRGPAARPLRGPGKKKKPRRKDEVFLVREAGLEPARPE